MLCETERLSFGLGVAVPWRVCAVLAPDETHRVSRDAWRVLFSRREGRRNKNRVVSQAILSTILERFAPPRRHVERRDARRRRTRSTRRRRTRSTRRRAAPRGAASATVRVSAMGATGAVTHARTRRTTGQRTQDDTAHAQWLLSPSEVWLDPWTQHADARSRGSAKQQVACTSGERQPGEDSRSRDVSQAQSGDCGNALAGSSARK